MRCREHICKVVKSGSPSHCQKQRPLPSQGLWYFVRFAEPSNFPVPGKNHEMIWSGIMVLDWCLLLSCVGNPVGNTILSSLVFRWETTDYTGCPPLIIGLPTEGVGCVTPVEQFAVWGFSLEPGEAHALIFWSQYVAILKKDRTANLPLWGFLLKLIFLVVRCPKVILLRDHMMGPLYPIVSFFYGDALKQPVLNVLQMMRGWFPCLQKALGDGQMGQTWGITVQVSLKALRSQGMMGRWYPRCVESRCLLEIRFKRWAAHTCLRVSERKWIFYTESIGWIHIYVGCICWCLRHSLMKPFMLIKIPFLVGWIPCSDVFRWYLKTAVFCC